MSVSVSVDRRMPTRTEIIFTAVIYFGYFVAAAIAVGLLAQQPSEAGALEYAYLVVFGTSGLHFGAIAYGYATDQEYTPLPVRPKWAFFYADMLMAVALGSTIAAYVLDHDNRTPAVIGNVTVMATQSVCAWKTWVLLTDEDDDGDAF